MYPELLDMVREVICILELVYEQGIRKGMEGASPDHDPDASTEPAPGSPEF